MKALHSISLGLGLMSLAFGTLKFTDPFRQWYLVQITTSRLPPLAYSLGIVAEIMTALLFLSPFLLPLSSRLRIWAWRLASISLIVVMMVATVVHLNPEVPAEVLPLKIKPPVIPTFFIVVAGFHLRMLRRKAKVSVAFQKPKKNLYENQP